MTDPKTFEQALWNIYRERLAVMRERQRKYGPHNVQGDNKDDALLGLAYRMRDKVARLKRAAIKMIAGDVPEVFVDESLEDTLIDMGNYSDIAIMVERGWWGLPMEGEERCEAAMREMSREQLQRVASSLGADDTREEE